MSTRNDKKHRRSSKAVDYSTDWSQWAVDPATQRWYRARRKANGEYDYEWDTAATSSVSQATPRSDPVPATLSPYASSTTSSDYGSEYAFQNAQAGPSSVDFLADRLSGASIEPQGRQSNIPSDSYGDQSYPSAPGGSDLQPIPIQSSLPISENYGYLQHSMSAPPEGNMGGFQEGAVVTSTGYNVAESSSAYTPTHTEQYTSYGRGGYNVATASTVFVPNASDQQTLASYGQKTTPFITANRRAGDDWRTTSNSATTFAAYGGAGDEPPQGEGSGSGAITPKATNPRIRGVAGAVKGDKEKLDPRFKVHPSKDFKSFQVFKVLWSEPRGETATSNATDVTQFTLGETRFGEKVHSSIRRFVVVMEDRGFCLCLPILTYQHQATKKWGVNRDDHAIIYTGNRPPRELEGEESLKKDPIEVMPKTPRDALDFDSRVNYAKVYTVEHNVKVLFVGRIAPNSQRRFMSDFDATWQKRRNSNLIPEE